MIASITARCPECAHLQHTHGETGLGLNWALWCERCNHKWTLPPPRSAEQLVSHLRSLLAADCDASRRRFYNAASTLVEIADALDAHPVQISEADCKLQIVPGDEVMACPFCGSPVTANAEEARVSHQIPTCTGFDIEVRKHKTFDGARAMLLARQVRA